LTIRFLFFFQMTKPLKSLIQSAKNVNFQQVKKFVEEHANIYAIYEEALIFASMHGHSKIGNTI